MTGKMISILARERTPIKKGKGSNFRSQKVQIFCRMLHILRWYVLVKSQK